MIDLILNRSDLTAARAAITASLKKGDRSLVHAAEAAVSASPREAITFDPAGSATVHVGETNYAAGRFETVSVGELKARVAGPGSKFRVHVLHGAGLLNDVAGLQATSDGDTLFQVASQFNCLEATDPEITSVESYFHDPTQGPRASISAFPGTLVRHYAAPRGNGERFVQTDAEHLNLLKNVCPPAIAQVKCGYLTSRDIRDPAAFAKALHDNFDAIQVGVHDGVEVVLGSKWDGWVDPARRPRIAQVFSSTYAGGGYSEHGDLNGTLPVICRQLLRATYLGTLLAAASLKKHKVVLTLIGGGVFSNSHALIVESILWAVREAEALAAEPIDVVINAFGGLDCELETLRAEVEVRHGVWRDFDSRFER